MPSKKLVISLYISSVLLQAFTHNDGYQRVLDGFAAAGPGEVIWPKQTADSQPPRFQGTPVFVVASASSTAPLNAHSTKPLCVRLALNDTRSGREIIIVHRSQWKLVPKIIFLDLLRSAITSLLVEEVRHIVNTTFRYEYGVTKGHETLCRVASSADCDVQAWPRNGECESTAGLTLVWGARHRFQRTIIVRASCNAQFKLLRHIAEHYPHNRLAVLEWNLANAPKEQRFIDHCVTQVCAE